MIFLVYASSRVDQAHVSAERSINRPLGYPRLAMGLISPILGRDLGFWKPPR